MRLDFWLSFSLTAIIFSGSAQNPNSFETYFQEVQMHFQEEEYDQESVYNQLFHLYQNPISSSEIKHLLHEIPFLNPIETSAIRKHVELYGSIISPAEFNQIPDLSSEKIKWLIPLVSFDPEHIQNIKAKIVYTLASKSKYLNEVKDYTDFLIRQKLNIQLSRYLKIGFHSESDPDEVRFKNKQLMDFQSFYMESRRGNDQFIVGDFHVNYGQGLAIWTGWSSYKNIGLSQVQKLNSPFQVYNGYDENNFFRGIAFKKNLSGITLFSFYSQKNIDAKLDQQSNHILTFPESGLHRTGSELDNRKSVMEKCLSGGVEFHQKKVRFQAYLNRWIFSQALIYLPEEKAKSTFTQSGLNWSYMHDQFIFFQELYLSPETDLTSISGIQKHLGEKRYLSALYRAIPKNHFGFHNDYHSDFSNSPQRSLYIAFDLLKGRNKSKIYIEQAIKQSLNNSNFQDEKREVGIQHLIKTKNKGILQLQIKKEFKLEKAEHIQKSFKEIEYYQFKFQSSFQIRGLFLWNQNFQIKHGDRQAWLYANRLRWKSSAWQINLGFGIYKQNKDALYIYEPDIPGISSFSGFFGKGIFNYLIISRKTGKWRWNIKYYQEKNNETIRKKLNLGMSYKL